MGPTRLLTRRELNRATLARQLLLERSSIPLLDAIGNLAGLQAQNPTDHYIGLWSRLTGFDPMAASSALEEREVVRAQLMRATIHLVTSADYPYMAGATAPVLERVFHSTPFARNTAGLDRDQLLSTGRQLLEANPHTRAELARALAGRWPDADAPSLAQAVTYLLPVVQIPPRGMWRRKGQARWAMAREWLGVEPVPGAAPDDLILRYLAAFGPATVTDARTWANLGGLADVFDRLRPRLLTFRDEEGRQLFDLPDAPRPHPDTPAPVRFLPEFDNVLLSHADRRRVFSGLSPAGRLGNLLVDGFLAGQWKRSEERARALIEVGVAPGLTKTALSEVEAEASRLARFLAPDADHDVAVRPI